MTLYSDYILNKTLKLKNHKTQISIIINTIIATTHTPPHIRYFLFLYQNVYFNSELCLLKLIERL